MNTVHYSCRLFANSRIGLWGFQLNAVCMLHAQSRREQVCKTLNIELSKTSNADILQRLVRRYLFKLERLKEDGMAVSFTSNLVYMWGTNSAKVTPSCLGIFDYGKMQTRKPYCRKETKPRDAAAILFDLKFVQSVVKIVCCSEMCMGWRGWKAKEWK